MDEERDGCRHFFQPLVEPLVANASSISEAALSVNRLLWSKLGGIYFKPNQTPDIMSPTQASLFNLISFACPESSHDMLVPLYVLTVLPVLGTPFKNGTMLLEA